MNIGNQLATVTKTTNPLHFEDLEPHRFEDLARQLIYDFRDWANLEATGRTGSDDGFDIRGRELIYNTDDIDEEDPSNIPCDERIWLIQCKREKSISPQKIATYLNDIFKRIEEQLYGIIFIAACNFSKKTRDTFITEIRKYGIKEFQLWGRAELEDLLFQPKNDHLLFAYFGISLSIRKRTLKTKLRSRIATKKKILHCIENHVMHQVLLRDANDTHYPYSDKIPDFDKNWLWRVFDYDCNEQDPYGLKFLLVRHMAYLADDQIHHDYIDKLNEALNFDDPWSKRIKAEINDSEAHKLWYDLPVQNRGHFEVYGVVEYDNILAIDEYGDNEFQGPHLYIPFTPRNGPFSYYYIQLITCGENHVEIYPEEKNRVQFFPSEFTTFNKEKKKKH